MEQMASGANAIKGTFTAHSEDRYYILNIGRTLNNYMFYIEMTPDSITRLSQTASSTTRKAWSCIGIYKFPNIAGSEFSGRGMAALYRTSDGARNTAAFNVSCTDDSITFYIVQDSFTQAGAYLYEGYTYNYTIFPMD